MPSIAARARNSRVNVWRVIPNSVAVASGGFRVRPPPPEEGLYPRPPRASRCREGESAEFSMIYSEHSSHRVQHSGSVEGATKRQGPAEGVGEPRNRAAFINSG